MITYPVRLARTGEGKVRAIFPDVPEAVAEAASEVDALYQAKFSLELSLGHYLINDRDIPRPSEHLGGTVAVTTDKFSLASVEDAKGENGAAAAAPGDEPY